MADLRITRRDMLLAAPAAVLTVATPLFAQPAGPSVAFIALGDWGRRGHDHQRDVARRMGDRAASASSSFTVTTGDNFYDNGVASTTDSHWRESFEQVYTAPALQRPWYPALGNHDYRGEPAAQIGYSSTSARWRMAGRFYRIPSDAGPAPLVELFVIDSQPMVHGCGGAVAGSVDPRIAANLRCANADAQLAWLERSLAESRAAWKLVVGHHPIWSGGEHGSTPLLVDRLRPILERRGVAAYVNGHDHDLQHIRRGALDCICSGGGSALRPTRMIEGSLFAQSLGGFALFRAERDALAFEFVSAAGQIAYSAVIPRPALAQAA